MSRSPDGRLDLLARGEGPRGGADSPERPRPGDPDQERDAFAPSRHSRIEMTPPSRHPADPAAATQLCAELTRLALGDLSAGLPLLGRVERRRAQALTAWTFTLFDFAGPGGIEGEKLAAINRWEFATEAALGGDPEGQPIFTALAAEHARRPWPGEAFDALTELARRRASRLGEPTGGVAEQHERSLAAALAHALLGAPAAPEVIELGAVALALHRSSRRSFARGQRNPLEPGAAAVERSAPTDLRSRLAGLRPPGTMSRPHRRAFAFLRGACLRFARSSAGPDSPLGAGPDSPLGAGLDSPLGAGPRLPLGARLRLLLSALVR